jgi:hypothetical protein
MEDGNRGAGSEAMLSRWARKFGLRPGMAVHVVDLPTEEVEILHSEAPDAVVLIDGVPAPGQGKMVFFWPDRLGGLENRFQDLRNRLADDGSLWAIVPKAEHRDEAGVDLTWDEMQAAALTTDLVDVKVASFSDRSYGTKFVIRKTARGRAPVSD